MRVRGAKPGVAVVALLLACALAGCSNGDLEDPIGVEGVAADLTGFWEGTGEITAADDHVGAGAPPQGFSFPVAIQLMPDHRFMLWSANFPVVGGGASEVRSCTGVYAVRRRAITLLADQLCRALPLARYSVDRAGVGRILLESTGTEPAGDVASVRVRLILERVTEAPALGLGDEDEDGS